jgi:hypothetical protein
MGEESVTDSQVGLLSDSSNSTDCIWHCKLNVKHDEQLDLIFLSIKDIVPS